MFCKKCGAEHSDNSQYCLNCGAPILSKTIEEPDCSDGYEEDANVEDANAEAANAEGAGIFEDIGRKIKFFTKVFFVISVFAEIIYAIVYLILYATNERYLSAGELILIFVAILLGLVIAVFLTYLSFMAVYAFGELVDTNAKIAKNTRRIAKNTQKLLDHVKHENNTKM